jgi:hypothetical protein
MFVHVRADPTFATDDVRLHETASLIDLIGELATSGAERIGDRDVDIFVPDVRRGDLSSGYFEDDADVELAAMPMTFVRLRDRDVTLRDPIVEMIEPVHPSLHGRLHRIAVLDSVKRDLGRDLHETSSKREERALKHVALVRYNLGPVDWAEITNCARGESRFPTHSFSWCIARATTASVPHIRPT